MGSLRLLLALAVAGGHAAGMFGFEAAWILPGSRAVQIFYVISGFLMAMILNGKYADTPRGNWIFYSNRCVKIFAPYLVILVATVAVCLICKAVTGNSLLLKAWFDQANEMATATWIFALLTNIFIVGQEWGFLLIYRAGSLFYSLNAYASPPIGSQFTVITPAWTLSIELLFYLIAPFIVRRNILLIAALALGSHCFRIGGYHEGYYSEATNYRFFPFELSLFLYGSLCFRIGRLLPQLNARWSAAIAAATILMIAFPPRYFVEHQYQLYAIIGAALPALFGFSQRNRWDRSLGELSYPLYLVHWPIVIFAASITKIAQLSAVEVYPVMAVIAALGAAILINRYIVDPLDAWRQSRVMISPLLIHSSPTHAHHPV